MTEPTDHSEGTSVRKVNRRTVLAAAGAGAAVIGAATLAGRSAVFADDNATYSDGNHAGGPDNFYTSDRVAVEKVTFRNQYQMPIVGNLFTPVDIDTTRRHPAIIVGHPMGAVKEQSSNLYATKLAEQGFVTLAIDQSFWGESGGEPRQAVLPDMYTEAFMASVDFLGTHRLVNRERIGILGICGSGSFVISAAKLDPRMKAVATVSMYDMGAMNRNALNHSQTVKQRKQILAQAAEQRYTEFAGGDTPWSGGTPNELTSKSTAIEREFYDFYRTPRGEFTPDSATPESTTHRKLSAETKFMNFYPFNDIKTISPRPMLFISGDQAHSREFSEDAFERASEPKELHWVRGAGHVDLYDRTDLIPFGKLIRFYKRHLSA